LSDLNLKYNKYFYKKNNIFNYEIYDRQIWEYFKQFGNSYQKFIPNEFLLLDKKYLQELLKFYLIGDCSYYSVSNKLKNNIQEILIKLGKSSKILKNYISIYNWKYIKLGNFKKTIFYKGYITCLSVKKNHIILIRRNGKLAFCGNCLRSYSDSSKELGKEKTFEEYIDNLVKVFIEIKRVLKPTGTCFVNLGDVYSVIK